MTDQLILSKLHLLGSEQLKRELLLFIDFLLSKQTQDQQPSIVERKPVFGCAKGLIKMADDFDAPLDDFKEYMP